MVYVLLFLCFPLIGNQQTTKVPFHLTLRHPKPHPLATSANRGKKEEIVRLHMQPVCNQRAANRLCRFTRDHPDLLHFLQAQMDMCAIHALTRVQVYIRTRARCTALRSPWAGPTTRACFPTFGLASGVATPTVKPHQETRMMRRGSLVAANSRSSWRDPGRCHGSPQPRTGPLGPVRPGRMTNWGRTRQWDPEGRTRFSYRH